jgi:hypothetical protein
MWRERAAAGYVDETAVSTNMVRLRGRAPRGVRVIGAVPLGRWETITFVAALRHNKMIAPMVVEGAMTGEMFLAYVENCLVPMLRRNDVVVMDNCRVHLGPGIGRAIETVGATLRYLPKYSPVQSASRHRAIDPLRYRPTFTPQVTLRGLGSD